MTQEKINEPPINPVNGDPFFNGLVRESEEAFQRHAAGYLDKARTELAAAEQEGDSDRAEKAAGSIGRLLNGVELSKETIANIDIPVTDMSGPAEAIEVQVQHEVQHTPDAHAA